MLKCKWPASGIIAIFGNVLDPTLLVNNGNSRSYLEARSTAQKKKHHHLDRERTLKEAEVIGIAVSPIVSYPRWHPQHTLKILKNYVVYTII